MKKNIKVARGVVEQCRMAFSPKARLATLFGFILGGGVPGATFWVAHQELDPKIGLMNQVGFYLIIGGLLFSAKTVYDWGNLAFQTRLKSLGFVILIEGVMISVSNIWVSLLALAYLVVINGIATGCNLTQKVKAS